MSRTEESRRWADEEKAEAPAHCHGSSTPFVNTTFDTDMSVGSGQVGYTAGARCNHTPNPLYSIDAR